MIGRPRPRSESEPGNCARAITSAGKPMPLSWTVARMRSQPTRTSISTGSSARACSIAFGERLAESDEKVREVVVANPVIEGKLRDPVAYDSRSMGVAAATRKSSTASEVSTVANDGSQTAAFDT